MLGKHQEIPGENYREQVRVYETSLQGTVTLAILDFTNPSEFKILRAHCYRNQKIMINRKTHLGSTQKLHRQYYPPAIYIQCILGIHAQTRVASNSIISISPASHTITRSHSRSPTLILVHPLSFSITRSHSRSPALIPDHPDHPTVPTLNHPLPPSTISSTLNFFASTPPPLSCTPPRLFTVRIIAPTPHRTHHLLMESSFIPLNLRLLWSPGARVGLSTATCLLEMP